MALLTPVLAPAPVHPARPVAPGSAPAKTTRDTAVDGVRAILLGVVVLLHSLMVGVSVAADGSPILRNAMEGWDGFAPLTWVLQIMPLFFVLGGFASYTQWTRQRARGATTGDYVAARMRRLLIPASGAILATAVLLAGLVIAGVPADVVATAGFRISQPLWFLGVYLGCSALVPFMVRLHERHRILTVVALAAGVVAVDIVRGATGVTAIGLVNMAFVWLLLQQIGFAVADGSLDRLRRAPLLAIAGAAVAVAGVLILTGAAPADLITALNPPMAILVVAGIAQTALFLVLRPRLRAWAAGPRTAVAVGWINARAMTIYSWHMLVVIAIAGAMLLSPLVLPVPLSTEWWAGRPLWFAAVLIAVALVVARVGRREAARESAMISVGAGRATVSALLGVAGVVTILVAGSAPAAWVIGAAVVLAALRVAGGSLRAG
ncbi:acyltransferase [Microbacterium sp. NPDC056052]|uniref:acyltransferase family protein n=1 Tax=Microbacterium sp. NPDC056052 TaxID=3345695 RepID=UPI0035DC097F